MWNDGCGPRNNFEADMMRGICPYCGPSCDCGKSDPPPIMGIIPELVEKCQEAGYYPVRFVPMTISIMGEHLCFEHAQEYGPYHPPQPKDTIELNGDEIYFVMLHGQIGDWVIVDFGPRAAIMHQKWIEMLDPDQYPDPEPKESIDTTDCPF